MTDAQRVHVARDVKLDHDLRGGAGLPARVRYEAIRPAVAAQSPATRARIGVVGTEDFDLTATGLRPQLELMKSTKEGVRRTGYHRRYSDAGMEPSLHEHADPRHARPADADNQGPTATSGAPRGGRNGIRPIPRSRTSNHHKGGIHRPRPARGRYGRGSHAYQPSSRLYHSGDRWRCRRRPRPVQEPGFNHWQRSRISPKPIFADREDVPQLRRRLPLRPASTASSSPGDGAGGLKLNTAADPRSPKWRTR